MGVFETLLFTKQPNSDQNSQKSGHLIGCDLTVEKNKRPGSKSYCLTESSGAGAAGSLF